MALIQCADCKREISPRAVACPHCGAPVASQPQAPSPPVVGTPNGKFECKQCGTRYGKWTANCARCGAKMPAPSMKPLAALVVLAVCGCILTRGCAGTETAAGSDGRQVISSATSPAPTPEKLMTDAAAIQRGLETMTTETNSEEVALLCASAAALGPLTDSVGDKCAIIAMQRAAELVKKDQVDEALTLVRRVKRAAQTHHEMVAVITEIEEVKKAKEFGASAASVKTILSVGVRENIAARDWRLADQALVTAEAEIQKYANSKVATTPLWKQLSSETTKLRKQLAPQLEKERALDAARGTKPVQSQYDGEVYAVKRFLQRTLNDPESYEHIESSTITTSGEYWVVTSRFRGKNAFGAKVINTKTFFIQGGEVVKVADAR